MQGSATLILAGDILDFARVLPERGKHYVGDRYGATEADSLDKLRKVVEGHPVVFAALKGYLGCGGQVLVMPGNHDVDFCWPAVFAAFRQEVGGAAEPQLIYVAGGEIHEKRIHIEHGNQHSYDNSFEHWPNPILELTKSPPRLERAWGTLFMDMVYNDLERTYPFVNKVPLMDLAWMALRHFPGRDEVSVAGLVRFAAFFLTKGKRFGWNRLLGSDNAAGASDVSSSTPVIEEFFLRLDADLSPELRKELVRETAAYLEGKEPSKPPTADLAGERLLGRTDERGLRDRARQLHSSGLVDVVAFGHTHVAVDGNKAPAWGRQSPRREFNTGSWVPSMQIGQYESPKWTDLATRRVTQELYYLVIECTTPPRATLELMNKPN